MLSAKEIDILGQIVDTTWGRSSTAGGVSTMSVKTKIASNKMTVTYTTVVTVATNVALAQQIPGMNDQGKQAIDKYIKVVKDEFKDKAGRALTTKLLDAAPSLEVMSLQSHVSPRRTVIFRYITIFDIK